MAGGGAGRRWQPAYVALGSNLADPVAQLQAALRAMNALADTRVVTVSPFYRSPPMGPQDQPAYVNAVAGLLTRLMAPALLSGLKAIERARGRPADAPRWGPRIIDLDIIAIGRQQLTQSGLTIPHPGAAVRAFVLQPLADIAPAFELPGAGRVEALLAKVDLAGLQRLETAA
ncbi:MAG: 2-amino-4-hydroxy-6-hydroxymethyldihydropteridine diphosphokinase [Gammaproteobacteria bacterium]|nr:MAG: 2-amino-4-hydroxy-6-hydroxymethyldihydropteridine diphosphokinase [Gammaproteobacteria bacterium]